MAEGAGGSGHSAEDGGANVRGLVIGAVIGYVVVFAMVMFLMWDVGVPLGTSAASAGFVALFGGIGYGGMVGAAQAHKARS